MSPIRFVLLAAFILRASLLLADTGDIDVKTAQDRYDRQSEVAERAKGVAKDRERDLSQAEGNYLDALSTEKLARDGVELQERTLKDIDTFITRLQNDIIIFEANIRRYRQDEGRLVEEWKRIGEEQRSVDAQVRDLTANLRQIEGALDLERRQAGPVLNRINQLETKKGELSSKIQALDQQVKQLESQIQTTHSDITKTQAAIDQEKAKVAPDQNKIRQLETTKSTLQSQLQDLQRQQSTLAGQIQAAKTEVAQAQKDLDQAQKSLSAVQTQLNKAIADRTSAATRVTSLEGQVSQLANQISQNQAKVTQLDSDIAAERAKQKPDQAKIQRLVAQKTQLTNDISKAENSKRLVEAQLTQARSDLTRLQTAEDKLRAEVAPLQTRVDQLQAQKNTANGKLQNLESQASQVSGNISTTQSSLKSTQAALDVEKAKVGPDQNKINQLEASKSNLQKKVQDLSQQKQTAANQAQSSRGELAGVETSLNKERADFAPTARKIADLEQKQAGALNSVRDAERRAREVQDRRETKERELRDLRANIDNAVLSIKMDKAQIDGGQRKREETLRALDQARIDLNRAQDQTVLAKQNQDQAKKDLISARRDFDREQALAQKAYDYLQQVIANYNAERDRILTAAASAGSDDGAKEASERAKDPGVADGKSSADSVGNDAGMADAKTRDDVRGYKDGRDNGATNNDLATFYQGGLEFGKATAVSKATKEDFPRGYNDALAALLAVAPPASKTVDISDNIPNDPGENGNTLSATPKTPGKQPSPDLPIPSEPPYVVPKAGDPQIAVPAPDKRYFNAPCNGLTIPDAEGACKSKYESAYNEAYGKRYQRDYTDSFKSGFSDNVEIAYKNGLSKSFADAYRAGQERGAKDAGILQGFADRLKTARDEQYELGRKNLSDVLATGHLIVVRSAELVETNGDGVYTPGEVTKLRVVIDNYGDKATPLSKIRVRLSKKDGLDSVNFEIRDLPALAGKTSTTLEGVVSATIADLAAGEKIKVEGLVELADGNGSYSTLNEFKDEKEVHFPVELQDIVLSKVPALDEAIAATFKFKNVSKVRTVESPLSLYTDPRIVDIEIGGAGIGQLEPGEAVQISAQVTPHVWVGENTYVSFISQTEKISGMARILQKFPKMVKIDRDASLLLFDVNGKAVPSGMLNAVAGSRVSFLVQFNYQRNFNLQGPFAVRAVQTSHPELVNSSNSTTGVDYGSWGPGMKTDRLRFTYDVPNALKGKKAWVGIQLTENGTPLHAMQVYLNVK